MLAELLLLILVVIGWMNFVDLYSFKIINRLKKDRLRGLFFA
ncbi:hypothetical protein ACIN8IBEIGE_160353 [Acinetobacter sp. 8I-beige]|nr:hypothetical protein ACIN8IBEIGE_160353 [Acinetobacter sp. 8I-beige]